MRAQTTLDFAIGAGVFLAVIVFTLTFVPGILSPFDLTGEEEPALSNQIADSLSQNLLGSPAEPHVLDRYCTVEFFNGSRDTPPDGCAYENTVPSEQFNLGPTQKVNITIKGDLEGDGETTQLCWEREGDEIDLDQEGDDWGLQERGNCTGSDDVTLATGDDLPATDQSTITARRVVYLHDRPVTMEVVVW